MLGHPPPPHGSDSSSTLNAPGIDVAGTVATGQTSNAFFTAPTDDCRGDREKPERRQHGRKENSLTPRAASSVLLRPSDVAALAAGLDPLAQVDRVFTALQTAFEASASAGGQERRFRSPLHSYAVARRCGRWLDDIVATGNLLTTARLKLGRRGQDLLLADTGRATTTAVSIHKEEPLVTAVELIAEAKAVAATAARLQATTGSGVAPLDAVLTARARIYTPLPNRSTRGVQAFDGWGYYGRAAVPQREGRTAGGGGGVGSNQGAGEPVVVLEVSAEQARQPLNEGDGRGATFGENMGLMASLLSVPVLRDHPGLVKFHPGVRVVLNDSGRAASGGGDHAAGGSPLHLVCERLQGWRSLREVVVEHGPLVSPSDIAAGEDGGLRVLRLWGRQLGAALECLGSRSLVLRDLRTSTVFVSPDGAHVKVVAFASLATLASDGTLSSEASPLDPDIHGQTQPLTPPEALTMTRGRKTDLSRSISNDSLSDTTNDGLAPFLGLATSARPGVFRATAAWDMWTLGVLLFELAFERPPPAYGVALGRAVAAAASTAEARDAPSPKIRDVARTVQYDFISAIGECTKGARATEPGMVAQTAPALAKALQCKSLGNVIGERDSFNRSTIESAEPVDRKFDRDDRHATIGFFRQTWIRRQLQLEERGEMDVMTWQTFRERIARHLEASIAAAAPPLTTAAHQQVSFPGGDEGGGRMLGLVEHNKSGEASLKNIRVAAAVNRTTARLREADAKDTGWLPFRVVRDVLWNELQLSFSKKEADMIAVCLREGALGDSGGDSGIHQVKGTDVLYTPLVFVLRASLTPVFEPRAWRVGDPPRPPTPGSFVELLCLCLEPDPERRPSVSDLLHLPFFSGGDDIPHEDEVEADCAAAAAYLGGSGNDSLPSLILRERVERPIQAIENACQDLTADKDKAKEKCESTVPICNISGGFGVGALAGALDELERLVHRGCANSITENPRQARNAARGHARVIDEIFESGVLVRASAVALRFLDQEKVRKNYSKK